MSGGPQGPLNLDELMARVRAEVSARGTPPSTAARHRVLELLATAARYAPVSSLVPEFVGWSLLRRSVAVPLSRAVMYLSRFITNKQALFNQALVDAARELTGLAGAGADASEELRLQVQRLSLEVRALQEAAPSAAEPGARAPAAAALAARLESVAVRLEALEAQVARPPPPPGPESGREGATPIGRRARPEP
ncbi:MAG TPA: hypothetical protein VND93_31320 [Myxococcales bacterium]|nr:hypothetical protein [Myxococcales bacterium]